MIITVFHEPVANLLVHVIIYTVILFGYREIVHYNEKKRLVRNLRDVNRRWLEVFELKRDQCRTFLVEKNIQPSKNIIALNFSDKDSKIRRSLRR